MMNERVNDWDLYVGRALWVYNMSVHKSTGMSPCQYVLNFERYIKPRMKLSESDRELWRRANEKFESFKVGEKVLKEVVEKGRLNVNKMEKFEGPYLVKKVWSNGLSYLLECVDERGNVSEIRAHHNQLRKWREPPEYLSIHPMNEWLRENRVIEEDDKDFWEGKQIVLIEKRQRSKSKSRKKDISKEVDKHNATKELQEYRNGMTYSICRFSLDSQKSEPIEIEQVEPGRVTINQEVGQVEATSRIASGRESVEVGQIAYSRERQEVDSFFNKPVN